MENGLATISRHDWSFDRRGEQDQARHDEKVKEIIQDHLEDIVSDGNIITADPNSKKTIKVPMRSLQLPRFKFDEGKEGVGSGNGKEQAGDIIGHIPGQPGQGEGAGNQPGEEYYETEVTLEDIQQMVFADLGLPMMKPKVSNNISSENIVFDDIRKNRSPNNLDIGRTVFQNMLRNAQETGRAELRGISPEDYRVRRWNEEIKPQNNAVVIAMADISYSMGPNEKYLTRAFCWWTVNFLRTKYPKVDIVFVAHDTEAKEVTEDQFFTRGSGGGTMCSSANEMALNLVNMRYPSSQYNIYPLHFSDGDNWTHDNPVCVNLVQQLLKQDVSQYAYIQVGRNKESQLLSLYNNSIHDSRFKGLLISEKQDVLPALKKIFNPQEQAA